MGLRINTNISALRALRQLQINDRVQARSLERLSTGLRINRASDDPPGLVISEQLRAQLNGLNRAVENSQNAANLINTADAAVQELSNLLAKIESSLVFVQNTGGASTEQIQAEQDGVDQAIAAIDRIVATTRFAGRPLINGAAEFLVSSVPGEVNDLLIRSVTFSGGTVSKTLSFTIATVPTRGVIYASGLSAGPAGAVIRITGPRGTEDVTVGALASEASIASAINSVAAFTGVFASSTATTGITLRTEEFGDKQLVRMQVIGGSLVSLGGSASAPTAEDPTVVLAGTMTASGTSSTVIDTGKNGVITFEGQSFSGVGRFFSVLSRSASFSFALDPDVTYTAGTSFSFSVKNTGLVFQLNELPRDTDRLFVSIPNLGTGTLGFDPIRDKIAESIGNSAPTGTVMQGGFVNSIKTGGANSLTNNPANATSIVKAAINKVAGIRGFLGAVSADAIEPNINSVGVHIENLSASLSTIRDLDFAQETANFTRAQILFQSTIAVLASANLVPQSVLALLR